MTRVIPRTVLILAYMVVAWSGAAGAAQVPNVLLRPVSEARAEVQAAGFQVRLEGGDPAPTSALALTVQLQAASAPADPLDLNELLGLFREFKNLDTRRTNSWSGAPTARECSLFHLGQHLSLAWERQPGPATSTVWFTSPAVAEMRTSKLGWYPEAVDACRKGLASWREPLQSGQGRPAMIRSDGSH